MSRLLLALLLALAACGSEPVSPSPAPAPAPSAATTPAAADPCHQGGVTYCVLNPAVTPRTVRNTVCVAGWTATVRPSVAYTSSLKAAQLRQLGLPGPAADYEEDHRLPLEGGGDPKDPGNLAPEPRTAAGAKDQAENQLRRDICAGGDLRALQAAFVRAWLGPWPAYGQVA